MTDPMEERGIAQSPARSTDTFRQQVHVHIPPQPIPDTDLTTRDAWIRVLDQLESTITAANYKTWIQETELVACDGVHATIVAPMRYHADWLRLRIDGPVRRALSDVLGSPIACRYVALDELLASGDGATAIEQPAPSNTSRPRGQKIRTPSPTTEKSAAT